MLAPVLGGFIPGRFVPGSSFLDPLFSAFLGRFVSRSWSCRLLRGRQLLVLVAGRELWLGVLRMFQGEGLCSECRRDILLSERDGGGGSRGNGRVSYRKRRERE